MSEYIAYCQDRHLDPVQRVFPSREKAIKFARKYMASHVAHPEGLSEHDDGTKFEILYEYEEDYALVVERP